MGCLWNWSITQLKDKGYQPVFNLNKFNEKLRNDARNLGYDKQGNNEEFLVLILRFILSPTEYAKNPNLNIFRGKVTNVSNLININTNINNLLNDFISRRKQSCWNC